MAPSAPLSAPGLFLSLPLSPGSTAPLQASHPRGPLAQCPVSVLPSALALRQLSPHLAWGS